MLIDFYLFDTEICYLLSFLRKQNKYETDGVSKSHGFQLK
jgi:hypothetical protein